MAAVRVLPNDLANQIAAGEVVERPASVVKELVENALDAHATKVRVEIDQGGIARIRVTDDGDGMDAADARLALQRHATSKIARVEDLQGIATFGFRGEALPSIGSVSRLTLTTRARGADEGLELTLEGGGDPRAAPAGCAVGTTVEVRDLFFNVPARRKFLKATATESAHVGEVILLAALARPDVSFTLVRDGRVAREYLRVTTRKERTAQAIGDERLEACVGERGPLKIEAHLAAPERARSGAVALHLFVNGRPVKDRPLARAVAQAYGSVLEPGRYPVGALYVDMPPDFVDVNVHPQKAEVRFADARSLLDAVTRELYIALAKAYAIPALGPTSRPWLAPRGNLWLSQANVNPIASSNGAPSATAPAGEGLRATAASETIDEPDAWGLSDAAPPTIQTAHEPTLFAQPGFYARLTFLAQIRRTYLVCEGEDGLYVLDQHAAAERVTFHAIRRAFAARELAAQRLLIAEIVELLPAEIAALEEYASDVAAMGLDVRAVGVSAVAVHAVPKILARAHPARLVRDLVAELSRAGGRSFGAAADRVLATMACHGSVRAGDALSREEAEALLRSLDAVDFSGHCPHGRPVITRLAYDELERRVGR
jgi:DNA mismatch repair protein MutL